jgi:hypothetical protein
MVGTLLMHRQTMGIDSQDLPWPELGGSHHLPLTLFMICHKGCIQMSFCLRTCKLGISKFPKLGHFLWKPSIEMKFKTKLSPLSRTFQQYVAHHLHACISRWLSTFSGWESN